MDLHYKLQLIKHYTIKILYLCECMVFFQERMWRKNRRVGTNCFGVDLNRNYNANWASELLVYFYDEQFAMMSH